MKKTKLAIYSLFVLFLCSCKKESTIPQTEAEDLKEEILGYLSHNLPTGYFAEIESKSIQLTSVNQINKQTAIVYFKSSSTHKSEFILLSLKNSAIEGELINMKIKMETAQPSFSGKILRTNLKTKEVKVISLNESTPYTNGLFNPLSTSNDPTQLTEIIVVGRVTGQSSFTIQAFIRGITDALNYAGVYFNLQNESVIPPDDYIGYGLVGSPEVIELEFESAEEAAAFQQWLNQISPAELALCLENPIAALQIYRNAQKALSAFPHWNGLGDAKRHAYWMALNAKDPLIGATFATRFGVAHETGGMPSTLQGKPFGHQQWQLEVQSDLYNNSEGIRIISLMTAAGLDLNEFNILYWLNTYTTPGGGLTYVCDPTPNDPGSGDEVLRFSNQTCP